MFLSGITIVIWRQFVVLNGAVAGASIKYEYKTFIGDVPERVVDLVYTAVAPT